MAGLNCPFCSIAVPTVRAYVSHIRLVHWKDSDFLLSCGVNGCTTQFKSFGAFNSHVYRRHRDALHLVIVPAETSTSQETVLANDDELMTGTSTEPEEPCSIDCDPTQQDKLIETTVSQRESAKFLLHLSQQHHLSQVAICDVIGGFQEQSKFVADYVSSVIAGRMIAGGISEDIVSIMCVSDDSVPTLFSGLESNYLREKYYQENFPYVVSTFTICMLT